MRTNIKELTDMHCHILPYVDDGARNMEEALEMLRLQAEEGVSRIFLTPHHRKNMFETPTSDIVNWYEALKEETKKLPNMPELLLGREYHCDMGLLELLQDSCASELAAARMGDGEGLLIEFSDGHKKEEILQYTALVKYCGFIPIVAHAERYAVVEEDPAFAGEMTEAGAWLQVNASSLLGGDGRLAKRLSMTMLKNDLIRLIGTDAHRTDVRTPNLGECARLVKRKVTNEQFERLFYENPARLYK